jgi:hypothetical protein
VPCRLELPHARRRLRPDAEAFTIEKLYCGKHCINIQYRVTSKCPFTLYAQVGTMQP